MHLGDVRKQWRAERLVREVPVVAVDDLELGVVRYLDQHRGLADATRLALERSADLVLEALVRPVVARAPRGPGARVHLVGGHLDGALPVRREHPPETRRRIVLEELLVDSLGLLAVLAERKDRVDDIRHGRRAVRRAEGRVAPCDLGSVLLFLLGSRLARLGLWLG